MGRGIISVINGEETTFQRTLAKGHFVAVKPKNYLPKPSKLIVKIKLPRATVNACKRPEGRSKSFSHRKDLDGCKAIIHCTNDEGLFLSAFAGVIKAVSHHARQFVLMAERQVPADEFILL